MEPVADGEEEAARAAVSVLEKWPMITVRGAPMGLAMLRGHKRIANKGWRIRPGWCVLHVGKQPMARAHRALMGTTWPDAPACNNLAGHCLGLVHITAQRSPGSLRDPWALGPMCHIIDAAFEFSTPVKARGVEKIGPAPLAAVAAIKDQFGSATWRLVNVGDLLGDGWQGARLGQEEQQHAPRAAGSKARRCGVTPWAAAPVRRKRSVSAPMLLTEPKSLRRLAERRASKQRFSCEPATLLTAAQDPTVRSTKRKRAPASPDEETLAKRLASGRTSENFLRLVHCHLLSPPPPGGAGANPPARQAAPGLSARLGGVDVLVVDTFHRYRVPMADVVP